MLPQTVSHYRILSKLGAGGMGEVYLAEDERLGRRVALKLLPAKFVQDAERVRRFEQEARAVGALSHPNILTIYEIGREEDAHYIAMEFVDGQTLRKRISQRRMRLAEALEIAIQLGDALAAAHAAGVTHRDIKPENVMLREDGFVKVLDFGLAKLADQGLLRSLDPSVTQAETVGDDLFATARLGSHQNTSPGVILGTVSYMSPEQARGQEVDSRTDLFSLGIVLFEMVAGRPPFEGASTGDMMVALLDRQPPPLARFAPEAPEELEWIVRKLLAKDRDERYQSARSLLADLRALRGRLQQGASYETNVLEEPDGVAEAARFARESFDRMRDSSRDSRGTGRLSSGSQRAANSLAVLPFFAGAADPDADYLSEGLPESLIVNLSRVARLRVLAWSTVARYRGREVDAAAVGRELGVRAVLTGRMVRVADQLVVKVELVSAADGAQLWGGRYQRRLDDLFTLEQELSREICEHLRVTLNEEEKARLARRYTENAAAWQAYLQGRYYWHMRSPRGLKKAIEAFQQAIDLDPEYALAYAGLADCYVLFSVYGAIPPRVAMPQAKRAALRALEIDEQLAEAHASLGAVHSWFDWDWPASEAAFRRAIELNPAYATAHHWYGSIYLCAQARLDEAHAEELKARELEPLTLVFHANLAWISLQAREYARAEDYCRQGLEIEPNFVLARFYLGLALAHQRRFAEAVAEIERSLETAGGGALITAALAYVHARAGQRPRAEALLAELQTFPANRDVSPFFLAMIHAGLEHRDLALKHLADAIEERFSWAVHLTTEPMFDGLRDDPRFAALVRLVGLEGKSDAAMEGDAATRRDGTRVPLP